MSCRVAAVGWGKTRLGVLKSLAVATRGGRAWWIAPTYKMSEVGWRPLRQLAQQIPGSEVRKADREIVLPTGGSVSVRSSDNPDGLRGEGLDFVVLDECAFIDEGAWVESLRPALADRQGKALFISTPKGYNWFWRIWNNEKDSSDWKSWHYTSYDNPFVSNAEIDTAKEQMPERVFNQEFMAEFIPDGGSVFRYIDRAAVADEQPAALPGHQYVFGIDFGRLEDYTVVTVMDVTESAAVYVDRYNTIDWTMQVDRIVGLFERFQPTTILAERNSMGDPIINTLFERDLPVQPFVTTNATKQTIIDGLALAFERSQISIIPHPALSNELQSYMAELLPSGLVRYSAPSGLHDDCVISLALAWYAGSAGGMEFA